MRALLRPGRDKSALSNIVAYVLLISITVALSVIVYGWLRFYVSGEEIEECSEDVNIIIRSYECFLPKAGVGGRIIVTLKNKGLFSIDGYELRVHDRPGATFGFYLFEKNNFDDDIVGGKLKPGVEYEKTYRFVDYPQDEEVLEDVTFLEVQPFMMENGEVRCQSYASQEVVCK